MLDLLGAAGLIAAATLTPGPNNLVVMRAAARGGVRGALPAIAGVVLGSLALLAVVAAGAGTLFIAVPQARQVLAVAGCSYLVWLGARLFASARDAVPADTHNGAAGGGRLPAGVGGLVAFQFLNPKSWVLVLTATAAVPAAVGALGLFLRLGPLFLLIATPSLLLWALFGAGVERLLGRRRERRWLDRGLAALLIASALLLLVEAWS
jgi:threonine/homoserine/homoserine lactone efflux protein